MKTNIIVLKVKELFTEFTLNWFSMTEYKFDRTQFKMQTFEESDQNSIYDKTASYSERLRQAYFLISQAYGFLLSDEPRLDKTCFSSRKLNG